MGCFIVCSPDAGAVTIPEIMSIALSDNRKITDIVVS